MVLVRHNPKQPDWFRQLVKQFLKESLKTGEKDQTPWKKMTRNPRESEQKK